MASETLKPAVLFIDLALLFRLPALDLFELAALLVFLHSKPVVLLFLLHSDPVIVCVIGKGGNGQKQRDRE